MATQRIASMDMDMDEERKRCTVVGRPVARTERAIVVGSAGPSRFRHVGIRAAASKIVGGLPAKQRTRSPNTVIWGKYSVF